MNRLLLLMVLLLFLGCSQSTNPEKLYGLWKLSETKIDKEPRTFAQQYISFDSTGVFRVARPTGDLSGFYVLQDDLLKFDARDGGWFNAQWHWLLVDETLLLDAKVFYRDKEYLGVVRVLNGELNTQLKFERVSQVEDYADFEREIVGDWQLYRTENKGKRERVANMRLQLNEEGSYGIYQDSVLLESGEVRIYSRFRSLYFSQWESRWEAHCKGDEMRLVNEQEGIKYWLRR